MQRNSGATLADVADAAGVGIATASRVVNGGVNVSPATLKRVQTAVRRLGYLPNHAARILKGGRTKTIGLLVPSIADSFFAACAEAAEEVARSHDSLLIVAVSKNSPDLEISNLSVLMRHRPDGLMLVPSSSNGRRLRSFVAESGVPVVTLDRPLGGCPAVLTNNFEAARAGTRHLLEHGYKRILCLTAEPNLYTIGERLRGYQAAMEEAGLPSMIDTTLADDAKAAEPTLRKHMASSPPEAIFTLKNSVTAVTYQALQKLRVAIPSQVALLGFDDFDMAQTLRPAITVIQQPIEEVGRQAAQLLFANVDAARSGTAGKRLKAAPVVLRSTLLVRGSCGCKKREPR